MQSARRWAAPTRTQTRTARSRQLKRDDDQPTIGLLLCREKNRLVAEYMLRGTENLMASGGEFRAEKLVRRTGLLKSFRPYARRVGKEAYPLHETLLNPGRETFLFLKDS
jgi:hypothetical protein